jgi:hypothetical protein
MLVASLCRSWADLIEGLRIQHVRLGDWYRNGGELCFQLGARCGEVDDIEFLEPLERQIRRAHDASVEAGASYKEAKSRSLIRKSANPSVGQIGGQHMNKI